MEINLQRIEINSFKGIDQSAPVILDLGKQYQKGKNITVFTGDQGVHKTSSLEGIMYMLGHNFNWTKDNMVNLTDDTINEHAELEIDGEKYRIKVTKNKFEFERFLTDVKRWIPMGEPRTTLQKMIGPLGISPMFLKEKSGAQQIGWFREQFGADETLEKKEENLKNKLSKTREQRKEENKKLDLLLKSLATNPIYRDLETYAKKFEKEVSVEAARTKLEGLERSKNQYNQSEHFIAQSNSKIKGIENEILDLELRLQNKRTELDSVKKEQEKGTKWLNENKDIPVKYDEAYKEFLNVSELVSEQTQYKDVQDKVKQSEELETTVQELDAEKDKTILKLLEITKKYLPEIPGLEIKVDKGIDNKGEEGVFYNKKTLAQLSESELWDLYMQICKEKEIRFVFIENLNALGSHATETINKLSADGVKIFASLMNKKLKSLKFSMTDKID